MSVFNMTLSVLRCGSVTGIFSVTGPGNNLFFNDIITKRYGTIFLRKKQLKKNGAGSMLIEDKYI